MARLSYGRRSSRTARRDRLANQQPREWQMVNGFTCVEAYRPDGWRFFGSYSEAVRAFGLVTS